MKYKVLLLALTLCLCGCLGSPKERTSTENPDFQVDKLFTKDGITVYRFQDGCRSIYFTKNETDWSETHNTGKTSYTTHERVPNQ
jgi:hypothetical protein